MSSLAISLFGKLRARRDERLVDGLGAYRVQELLCYLLLHRDHSHARETLAGLLWLDSPISQSRKFLRQALWRLQIALDPPLEGPPDLDSADDRLLLVKPDWVHLQSTADLWLDVAVFEEAFALVQGVAGPALETGQAQALKSATQLYQGDLLEGWYQDWCLYERERLQNMYLAMLDKLMGYSEAHREYEEGLAYGAQVLRYDRARERTHRRLMRLHYLAGDRTAALHQYQRCVAALHEELGVRLAKRTVALYEQIRADQLEGLTGVPFGLALGSEELATPLHQALDRLTQFQTVLTQVQRQVQHEIRSLESSLQARASSGDRVGD